jgi:hypothetical protein
MPKTYSLLKVEDADEEGKTVTDKDADFHEKQKFRRIQISNTSTSTDALTLQTTNDNTASGPIMTLTRISANPAKSDILGKIQFKGQNSDGTTIRYASIDAVIRKTTAGDDESKIQLTVRKDGNHKPILCVSNEGALLHIDAPVVFQNSGYKKTFVTGSATGKRRINFPDQDGEVIVNESGKVMAADLPTSDPSNTGQLWNDSGTVKISAG